ncbi:MAG: hypothetical protein ACK5KP_05610 [Paludibacteraceae bacterium]
MKFIQFLLGILLLSSSNLLFSKELTPVVTQFNKKDYNAGNQNWSVAQDSRGILYFENNIGLMQFDGSNFKLFKMPNSSAVRAVYIDKADRIYVGSFREFGYFEKK